MIKLACVAALLLLVCVYGLVSKLENPPRVALAQPEALAPVAPPVKKNGRKSAPPEATPSPEPVFAVNEQAIPVEIEQVMRDSERLSETWDEYEIELYQDVFKLPPQTIATLHDLDELYVERFTKLGDQMSEAPDSEKTALAQKFDDLRKTYNVQLKDILGAQNYEQLKQVREDFNATAQTELNTSAQVYWY